MAGGRIWFRDGKILMQGGQILFCDECPCGGCETPCVATGCCLPTTLTLTITGSFSGVCAHMIGQSFVCEYDSGTQEWRYTGGSSCCTGSIYVSMKCEIGFDGQVWIGVAVSCTAYVSPFSTNYGTYLPIDGSGLTPPFDAGTCGDDPPAVSQTVEDYPYGLPMGGVCNDSPCTDLLFYTITG